MVKSKERVDAETGEVVVVAPGVRPMLRAAYDDHMPMSNATGLGGFEESRTQQSFAEEVDINTIVRRFGLTGQLPSNIRAPQNADFTGAMTFQESMNAILAAEASFMELPADVRYRFKNDPAAFVEFCSKEENVDEMGKLGLLVPEAWQKRQDALRAKEEAEFDRKAQEKGYARQDPPKGG